MIKIFIYIILGIFIITSYASLICLIRISRKKMTNINLFYFLLVSSIILLVIFGVLRNI
ncbi:MAG: hypothetical protein MRZ09_06975 [Coprobacillus sp.]|nr:hypothetical protein [Coprobacillus sp.]MDY4145089.1 hypothetical protein [Bacilli bacterium]CCY07347.1 unknown [Coprobacillus sp. CAG:698]